MSPLFICYVRGTNLLAQYDFNYGASDDYTYYLQNAHGDVTALLDTAGELTKSYVYDAFGVEQNIDDSDSNAFRYCGEYYDTEAGTIYLRARYYNPVTGRFISRDSYTGEHGDPLSLNLYTYCKNSPVLYADPDGHSPIAIPMLTLAAAAVLLVTTACVMMSTPAGQEALNSMANAVENQISAAQNTISNVKQKVEKKLLSRDYTVYTLVDDEGDVQYVGRTTDPVARESAHKNSFRESLTFTPVASGLTYFEARGLEQIGMLYHHTIGVVKTTAYDKSSVSSELGNRIFGISPINKKLELYMEAGRGVAHYIDNQISNEILNWSGK